MKEFNDFLMALTDENHRKRAKDVLDWVSETFPMLKPVIKWNQPMFTDHGTFIIGFSASKQHLAVSPEQAGMEKFSSELKERGIDRTKMLIRFPWDKPIDFDLLKSMIEFNIMDKADCDGFWRK
ncbi:MAG: iron chaperone [Eubacteriales bacterium]